MQIVVRKIAIRQPWVRAYRSAMCFGVIQHQLPDVGP